jgi:hypothetical protein
MGTLLLWEPDPTRKYSPDLDLHIAGKLPLFEYLPLAAAHVISVTQLSPTRIRLAWNTNLQATSSLSNPSSYSLQPVNGQPLISVVSASFDGTSRVILSLGSTLHSGYYNVVIQAGTAIPV